MIYKRGNQCWYKFRWTVKNTEGAKESFVIRRSAKTGSKKRAKEVEEEHRRALRLGLVHPVDAWPAPKEQTPRVLTLRGFAPRFLENVEIHRKAGTNRFYTICTNRILRFSPIADAPITTINSELIGKYVQWRRAAQAGNAVVTINGELRTLRRMLRLAHEWSFISIAPAVHELPGEQGRERVIGFEEELRYLATAPSTLKDAAILAADTGMRPNSEMFVLEWRDVHLQGTDDAPLGFVHVREGKTPSAVRNIPLTSRSREMLLARQKLLIGPKDGSKRCGDLKYVFPGGGKSGHLVSLQHPHQKTIERTGMDECVFYSWRHTFGTRCAESGMDRFTLARLMGHSSPKVAERYYVHVTESHVMIGFERFSSYQEAGVVNALKERSRAIQ
jgi:integrase